MSNLMEIPLVFAVLSCVYFPHTLGYEDNFTVSVYQMQVTPTLSSKLTRKQAVRVMDKRIAEFEIQAKEAARRNSRMLVLPEYSLYADFTDFSRTTMSVFLERIPNPRDFFPWTPCDLKTNEDITMLSKLSCIAKKYNLYLVANIGEREFCLHSIDPNCPTNGQYQFNTNVVFDSYGTLVSRYRKRYLFHEFYFDSARTIEHWVIDTPFGRFVNIIGFDLMFSNTLDDIVEQYGVRNIILSNMWPSVIPLYVSVSFHASVAWATNINLISANMKITPHKRLNGGSGFYRGDSSFEFSYQAPYLMTANMSNLKESTLSNFAKPPHRDVSSLERYRAVTHNLDETEIKSVKLTKSEGVLNVCYRQFCCVADYKFASEPAGISGYFLSINSYSDNIGMVNAKFCVITTLTFNQTTCPVPPVDSGIKFASFEHLDLYGNRFGTKYMYPQVLYMKDNDFDIPNPSSYYNKGKIKLRDTPPLYSASLIGRIH